MPRSMTSAFVFSSTSTFSRDMSLWHTPCFWRWYNAWSDWIDTNMNIDKWNSTLLYNINYTQLTFSNCRNQNLATDSSNLPFRSTYPNNSPLEQNGITKYIYLLSLNKSQQGNTFGCAPSLHKNCIAATSFIGSSMCCPDISLTRFKSIILTAAISLVISQWELPCGPAHPPCRTRRTVQERTHP